MKTLRALTIALVLVATGFLTGTWITWTARERARPPARKVLYWVDPMHPSYKSDKPGIAPDCGMQLEPVYADDASALSGATLPPGTLKVTPERQQLIGITSGRVETANLSRTIRTVGKVVADENRVYRLVTSTDGWVRQVFAGQTGGIVSKGQLLLTFYSKEALTAQQTYFYTLGALDRFRANPQETAGQIELTQIQVRAASEALQTLGMGVDQINAIAKTRQAVSDVEVRSPATGYIASRNVYPLQRFDRSTELYQIVDVSHVWILADVFESDAGLVRPGMEATVSVPYQQGETLPARVGDALPQFDLATRTLKLRLEAGNRDFILRPEMLVDIELKVDLPDAMTVPADALVDSGGRKVVFVDRGNGYFEPRRVQTGWRFNDRVQILRGLMADERIVLSGNFLLDSESRMRLSAMGISTPEADPVCGMEVDQTRARTAGKTSTFRGTTYYFCSDTCKKQFDANPAKYAGVPEGERQARRAQWGPAASSASGASVPPYESALTAARPSLPLSTSRMGGTRLPWVPSPTPRTQPDAGKSQAEPAVDLALLRPEPEAKTSIDPVSHITVDEQSATEAGLTIEFRGTTYYFAAREYRDAFQKEPERYAGKRSDEPRTSTPPAPPAPPGAMPKPETERATSAPASDTSAIDPVCGMQVDVRQALAAGRRSDYKGRTYYFCSDDCKAAFDKAPEKFIRK